MDLETYFDDIGDVLRRTDARAVQALEDTIADAYWSGRCVFIVGNGGSAANASHLCEDLGKGTLSDFEAQRRLKVISLTDNTPYIMAWANDEGYERVFVEQLRNLARRDDALIAISGSGNSVNVIKAVEYANELPMVTFGITGFGGGRLRQLAQRCLVVPSDNMGAVEAVHGVIFHYLVDALRVRFASAA